MENNQRVGSEPPRGTHGEQPPVRGSSADTERPPSAQRVNPDGNDEPVDVEVEKQFEEETDPAEKLGDMDWKELAVRYHAAIKSCEETEIQLMEEWESLMNFFRIWAESGQSHETDRTYKRLRTRMAHVQNSEESLESKRLHYISVVQAFESALKLLTSKFG